MYKAIFMFTLPLGLFGCKLSSQTDSDLDIAGGAVIQPNDKGFERYAAVRALVIENGGECTGVSVTLGPDVSEYVVTSQQCANALRPTGSKTKAPRASVMVEADAPEGQQLGLIRYESVSELDANYRKPRPPLKINMNMVPNVGSPIVLAGFGCRDVQSGAGDSKDSHINHLSVAEAKIATADLESGTLTVRTKISELGPKNGAGCPNSPTADTGAAAIWYKDKQFYLAGIVLKSEKKGGEIITTIRHFGKESTKSWLRQYLPSSQNETFMAHGNRGDTIADIDRWNPYGGDNVNCREGQFATGVWANGESLQVNCQNTHRNAGKRTTGAGQDYLGGYAVLVHNNHDDQKNKYDGEWAHGERKFECAEGHFISRLARTRISPVGLRSFFCERTKESFNAQKKGFAKHASEICRSVGTGGYWASCDHKTEYLGGLSVKWHSVGDKGSNHVGYLLCCKYQ